jgi:RNAse (barnase) inhibitor barstar
MNESSKKGNGKRVRDDDKTAKGSLPADSPALPREFVFFDSPAEFRDPAAIVVRVPRGIRSKKKLFAIFADKLHFPRYFGKNWDALEECLRDLSWIPMNRPIAIVHEDVPFGAGGANRGIYLELLRNVLDYWLASGDRVVQAIMPASLQMPLSQQPPRDAEISR